MRSLVLASSLILLTACSPNTRESSGAAADSVAMIAPRPGNPAMAAQETATGAAADAAAAPARPAVTIPMLAYRYAYALEAPPKAIRGLVARHEAACQAAGPAICQMVGAQVSELGEDRIRGQLTLRATPAWVQSFRNGLEGEAKAAGGRIVSANVDSEDLSRQIVDTEAAIRARITLRDRLQSLLAARPGKLAELLEVERELARVQGEIDATQSELAVMRGRVATSELRLTYESTGVLAPQGVLSPLTSAFGQVAGIIVGMLAGLVIIAAYLLPIALLLAIALWFLRGRMPKPTRKTTRPPAG